MASRDFAGAFHFRCGSSGRFMKSFCRRVGGATNSRASFGKAKTGSVELAREPRPSFRRHPSSSSIARAPPHDSDLKGRGSDKQPGEFRESQNWIGGTRPGTAAFVPPPPELVLDCMSALERFLHDERGDLPLLVKAGLVHVQFETIHPFLDGNGRLGRLLITFLLCATGVLREPILYLSLHFKQHRAAYYELLDRVRTKGDRKSVV